jgi:hypothetical protein
LAGRWGDGLFGGGWHLVPRFPDLHGRFKGHYTEPTDEHPDGGLFRARYASEGCLQRPDDEPLATDDDPGDQEAR